MLCARHLEHVVPILYPYDVLIKVARFFNEAYWPHTWNTWSM